MSDYRLTDEELSDLIDSPTINLFQRAYLTELRDARKALAEREHAASQYESARDAAVEKMDAYEHERDTLREQVAKIAAIVNAHFNGDDGELTPGQSRTIALQAIADVLGKPF